MYLIYNVDQIHQLFNESEEKNHCLFTKLKVVYNFFFICRRSDKSHRN